MKGYLSTDQLLQQMGLGSEKTAEALLLRDAEREPLPLPPTAVGEEEVDLTLLELIPYLEALDS